MANLKVSLYPSSRVGHLGFSKRKLIHVFACSHGPNLHYLDLVSSFVFQFFVGHQVALDFNKDNESSRIVWPEMNRECRQNCAGAGVGVGGWQGIVHSFTRLVSHGRRSCTAVVA